MSLGSLASVGGFGRLHVVLERVGSPPSSEMRSLRERGVMMPFLRFVSAAPSGQIEDELIPSLET